MALNPKGFEHPALPDPCKYIRILELLPASFKFSGVETRLQAVALDDQPVFEALSYTWGRDEASYQIRCNGYPFAVRPNLLHALKRLRYRTKSRFLWIDAICIDQDSSDSMKEKNAQIPLMRRIYADASQVFIWLGEAANGSAKAMAMMHKLSLIDSDDFGGNSRALLFLFRDPEGWKLIPVSMRNWFEECVDDDSNLYEDSDDEPIAEGLARIPGNLASMVSKAFMGLIVPEDPLPNLSKSSIDSDSEPDSSIVGYNRLADVWLLPRGYLAWKALQEFVKRP